MNLIVILFVGNQISQTGERATSIESYVRSLQAQYVIMMPHNEIL